MIESAPNMQYNHSYILVLIFQFASTAKKMKNDPHVTEVSDDGALLKRYRNEIVDLKRRLQEASVIFFLFSLSNK